MFIDRLPLVYACPLLTTLISVRATGANTSTNCKPNYFGDRCEFKCHCKLGVCDSNGRCSRDKCREGFFGPSCQYMDLLFLEGSLSNPKYTHGYDGTTCNPNPQQKVVEFTMSGPVVFYWMRLHVKNARMFDKGAPLVTITIDQSGICVNQQLFAAGPLLDIVCAPVLMNTVAIHGRVVGSLCSVYISGGRNVAINQNTSQTSTWSGDQVKAGPQNAVDGSTQNNFETSDSCSRTDDLEEEPRWILNFSSPRYIFKMVIFSEAGDRGLGYSVEAFSEQGLSVYKHTDDRQEATALWTIQPFPQEPILSITISNVSNSATRSIILCEVLILAETICPEGKFGFLCENNCSCTHVNSCHVATGLCSVAMLPMDFNEMFHGLEVCPNGTYGVNCNLSCPEFCMASFCDQETGLCSRCDDRHNGSYCQNCVGDTYGRDCSTLCPVNCLVTCHSETGTCDACKTGYTGDMCQDKSSVTIIGLVVAVIVSCVCLSIVGVYFLRRPKSTPDMDVETGTRWRRRKTTQYQGLVGTVMADRKSSKQK